MYSVKDLQTALIRAGFPVGKAGADGIMGRDTQNAIRLFQRQRQLGQTGVMDDRTASLLFGTNQRLAAADEVATPWFGEAQRLMGIHEKRNASVVLGFAKSLGGLVAKIYKNTDTAWCGLYVAHCISYALSTEPLPSNPLGARNWLKFGVSLAKPAKGCVVVFWRGSKSGYQGHVGFYVGEDATAIHVLGGNQSDQVSITRISKDRVLGYRWPSKVDLPKGGPVHLTANGTLSQNEA